MPFFIALLCTLQAAKDILYWKGNHDSSPDRINLTDVQSLAVCHVTVPARLIFFYSIDETPPSIEFWFRFLIGWLPKHADAHQRSPPTPADLSAVTFKGTERESEKKQKSLASSSLFFQSSGREGRSGLRIWLQNKCVKSQKSGVCVRRRPPWTEFSARRSGERATAWPSVSL